MRILVTGAGGQLGQEVQGAFAHHGLEPLDRAQMDVTDYRAVREVIGRLAPELVLHTAAFTDVDGCERDPDRAHLVNSLGTQNVALGCQAVGAAMVYISTDYVFDGEKGAPYLEDDHPNPLGAYGRSKLGGEHWVQALLNRFYIVRTAWLFGGGKNFVRAILQRAAQGGPLFGVTDEVGSPTWARDLAQALAKLVESGRYGVYHLTNEGACSRYEYVREILKLSGKAESEVVPLTSGEYQARFPLPTRRPAYSALRNFAASSTLGITMRPWPEALQEFLCSPP